MVLKNFTNTRLITLTMACMVFFGITQCDKAETDEEIVTEPADLTHLPFGGVSPTNILIRNKGVSQPDYLSLWLCGLPSDGAGTQMQPIGQTLTGHGITLKNLKLKAT